MGTLYILLCTFCVIGVFSLPQNLLYEHNVPEAQLLPQGDDISSAAIVLKVPIIFFGEAYDVIYVNSNGLISFQTEITNFFNIEFPLDYPAIAPLYSNVDTSSAGKISYFETESPDLIQRATETIHDTFLNHGTFQATSLFIVTWDGVGYFDKKSDKVNTYQVVIASDGVYSFVEFLYPENGIQWIQSNGDESGLPDARARVGFISVEGKVFLLPGSGTEQVRNLDKWSNMNLAGQWIFEIDKPDILEPDQNNSDNLSKEPGKTCAEAPTYCHIKAKCTDYDNGFCCQCNKNFYGNGKSCIKNDAPLRVSGKINGNVNGERLVNLDLQSYIVMVDARAYTAISRIPESIGPSIQSLQILGSTIAYLFAKPLRGAFNGYQLTGGVFNHTARLHFVNTNQTITIKQKYIGLDVFDQLRLEANVQGEIPILPDDAKVEIDEYQEEYTVTSPGTIQQSSQRKIKYLNDNNQEFLLPYTLDQVYQFNECEFGNSTLGSSWKLLVAKNFISYESTEQIIRFGMSNKIAPFGDYDPCEEGKRHCKENSVCVVDNDSYSCVCKPGFQQYYSANGTVCEDTNECQTGLADCNYYATCINEVGGYSCQCNPGFEGDGRTCISAASCENVKCNENAECVVNGEIASCQCLPGFISSGGSCRAKVDHSCHLANNCSPYAMCTINPQTDIYSCICLPGYQGDGYHCEVIVTQTTSKIPPTMTESVTHDMLITTTDKVPQDCNSTSCWCPNGFLFDEDKRYCVRDEKDIPTTISNTEEPCNEINNCHPYAQCKYLQETSSYGCICNEGYEGDGYKCSRLEVSCMVENNCDIYATCSYDDSLGKSRCICNRGYEGDGYTCTLAICTTNEDCSITEECKLTNNRRYECVCKEGYKRDSQNLCVDNIDTCGGGICVEDAECLFISSDDTSYCSCKAGYIGDGITECKLKPVECNVVNNCGLHAVCLYDELSLSYQCKCSKGFQGDGFVCQEKQTCRTNPALCDPNASCVATSFDDYNCQCNLGFIGNGTKCNKNPSHEGNFVLLNQGMATLKIPLDDPRRYAGKTIQVKAMQTAVGLDVDCFGGRFYWSDVSGRAIRSAFYNGTDKKDFITEGIGSPEGIAVDWVSRNIYWTDSTKDTIDVASLDDKRRVTLINTDLVNPRGIAVHPQRGKIFWTDWDRTHPKIEWANADGSERAVFLDGESVSLPNSLVIDFGTEQLCYADAGTKKIECIQIDSRQKYTVASNCTYPFGVTVNDKYIFWSDWITKKVERIDKFTLKRLPSLNLPIGATNSRLFELVAVPMMCPDLANLCHPYYKSPCPPEHICLPNGRGSRTCTCSYKANSPLEKPNCELPQTEKLRFPF